MAKILVVEDDAELLKQLVDWLVADKFDVESANNGNDGDAFLKSYKYDLVILDWDLPGKPGIELLTRLRSTGDKTPVLMLTGKASLTDKETGLDSGADDYLTKPFHFRELMARVRAGVRRSTAATGNTLQAGKVTLEPAAKRCLIGQQELHLQPKEFALLEFLIRHPNEAFDGNALLERVWPSQSDATANTVKTYMYTLRRKLAAKGCESLIQTVHGSGYRLTI